MPRTIRTGTQSGSKAYVQYVGRYLWSIFRVLVPHWLTYDSSAVLSLALIFFYQHSTSPTMNHVFMYLAPDYRLDIFACMACSATQEVTEWHFWSCFWKPETLWKLQTLSSMPVQLDTGIRGTAHMEDPYPSWKILDWDQIHLVFLIIHEFMSLTLPLNLVPPPLPHTIVL